MEKSAQWYEYRRSSVSVFEARGLDIAELGAEHGHRVLRVVSGAGSGHRWVVRGRAGDAERMRLRRPARYTNGARLYDVVCGERPVYRAGRVVGIEELQLRAGDRVLDVGCGTGLNFALLVDAVGPGGAVVGVDASGSVLARARSRVAKRGWRNVSLVKSDAARLDDALSASSAPELFDAALFTYSLSIIEGWRDAYAQTVARVRPSGRIAVVDMALPVGRWRVFSPLAQLACFTGGADITRAPWKIVVQTTTATRHRVVGGGHIHIGAGRRL